jgi:DNA-binding MarR family transcriptional regulator
LLINGANFEFVFDHCLYFNSTALARVVEREWTSAFKPFALTPPQAFMLRLILSRPGLTQREIAKELTISAPTATRLLDGLERQNLALRRQGAVDARSWLVFPTRRAEALHPDLDAASGAVTQRIKRLIGDVEFKHTVGSIRAVCSALK